MKSRASFAAAVLALFLAAAGCGRAVPPGSGNAPITDAGSGGWEEIRIGTDAVFSGLHFVDRDVGWIVGSSPFVSGGIVGRTEDGGKTWKYRTGVVPRGGPTASLNAVHGFDRQRACVAGDRGILLTFDGGESWQTARHTWRALTHLFGLHFLDEREGWAAGPAGVAHTTDGGLTWAWLGNDSSTRVAGARAVYFFDSKSGWLAGQNANLWRTRDGGETWARVPIPQPETAPTHPPYLFGMTWADASRGWVVGEFGTILHTQDGGNSWSLQNAGTREAFLTAVQFVDRAGWIVGFFPDKARSSVWRTADAGRTWSVERQLDGEELRALQMLDANTGWTVGDRVTAAPQRMLRRRRPEG